ncbi:MAG TPA: hypothetical protein PLP17_15930, partial [Oligoflexia bacterium]|nr:hypothetical protein [Oligoflexia bacterium]
LSPGIYIDYFAVFGQLPVYWDTPTLGGLLDKICGYQHRWLKFLPTVAALLSAAVLIVRYFGVSRWRREILYLLIPISLFSTPYCWVYDYVLMFPVLVWLIFQLQAHWRSGSRLREVFSLSLALLLANIAMFFMPGLQMQYYSWYPPLIALLAAVAMHRTQHLSQPPS